MPFLPKSWLQSLAAPTLFALLAGCQASGLDMQTGFATNASYDLALPTEMAVVPFASSEPEPVALAEIAPLAEIDEAQLAAIPREPDIAPSSFAKVESPAAVLGASASEVDHLIAKYAAIYEVPVELVRSVVKRESTFNPKAYNNGHWGLMQIKHATARGMGYKGPARGLLDAETNLKYAVKYLKGAYMVAGGDHKLADRMYQRGYYYDAKRAGLLDETGLGRDRVRRRGS